MNHHLPETKAGINPRGGDRVGRQGEIKTNWSYVYTTMRSMAVSGMEY